MPTFIDIVPFLINIVPTNNLFLWQCELWPVGHQQMWKALPRFKRQRGECSAVQILALGGALITSRIVSMTTIAKNLPFLGIRGPWTVQYDFLHPHERKPMWWVQVLRGKSLFSDLQILALGEVRIIDRVMIVIFSGVKRPWTDKYDLLHLDERRPMRCIQVLRRELSVWRCWMSWGTTFVIQALNKLKHF